MSERLDRIEEHRFLTAGQDYEAWRERVLRLRDELLDDTDYTDAYEPDDPKNRRWHETMADVWDSREGK